MANEAVVETIKPVVNTLNEALVSVVNSVIEAKEFLITEIPDVVAQLLMWKMAEASIYIGIYLVVVLFSVLLIRHFFKVLYKTDYEEEDIGGFNDLPDSKQITAIACGVIGGIMVVVEFILIFEFFIPKLKTIIQIWIAPKIYLIEYTANLVR